MSKTFDYSKTSVRNSIKAPARGITRMMWELFDTAQSQVTSQHLRMVAEQTGWNERLLRSHFRQHRAFHA